MFSVKIEKIWTILSVIMLALLVLAEALTLAVILQMNILPIPYVIVLIVLMAVSVLVIALLMFLRVDGQVRLSQRIVSTVLAAALVCFCAYITNVTAVAHKTIQAVTNAEISNIPTGKNMYVLVRSDDPAATLKDAANYSYGVIENHDVKRVAKFTQWIGKQTGVTPQPAGYVTLPELADALLKKNINAIIISGASIGMLEEQTAYADFTSKIKILAEVPFTDLQDKPATPENPGSTVTPTNPNDPTEAPNSDKNVTNTPFAIYIGASDQYGNKLYASRSDVNILMVVNPVTKQILLINTPRDAYVANPEGDGEMDKLTHCGLYGPDCSAGALSTLYGTPIDYFGQINFSGFKKLIDAIGGITVYSDQAFTTFNGHSIKKGENTFNGEQALAFARERYNVIGGDNGRGKNQMKVITAVIKKLTTSPALITNYASIMASMQGMFKTNMQADEISMLVKMQLSDLATWEVNSFAVTGKGGSEVTYSWAGVKVYVMHLHQNAVEHASNLIKRLVTGEALKPEDMKVPK